MKVYYLLLATCVAAAPLLTAPARADSPVPITLNFPASDAMSVSDILRAVAMQTGDVILPDSSVVGLVGDIHVSETSVTDVLTYLKTFEPGLTWQIIYYPAGSNEPAGEDLYQAVQYMTSSDLDGIVIPPAGDQKLMVAFKKQLYTTPDQEKAAEAGYAPYYLVSDPTERAQQAQAAKAALQPPPPASPPVQFQNTLDALTSQITKLTPQQQVAALNEMAITSRQIVASISPQALAALKAQAAGVRNQ